MTINTKTRKKLWAKSGNRCAVCKKELFNKESSNTSLNIGEECHIISSKKNGPRYKSGVLNYDSYDNLLLLCRNHHKEVDTLIHTYSEDILMFMKTKHENWVKNTLDASISNEEPKAKFLTRITSGKELYNIISNSEGYRIDYDEGNTNEESEFIGTTLQTLTDYADLSSMIIEPLEKVKIATELKNLLRALELKGYILFAESNNENIKHEGIEFKNWKVATLILKKNDDPEIIKI